MTRVLFKVQVSKPIELSLELCFNDLWIGLYWRESLFYDEYFICIIPCLPIHLKVRRHRFNA